jgi:recombination protein RecA
MEGEENMSVIKRREKTTGDLSKVLLEILRFTNKEVLSDIAREVAKDIENPIKKESNDVDLSKVISTGSTLLDLIISGGRRRGGGVPGGIVMEVYGPAWSGKTAILSEMSASVQLNDGDIQYEDPEGRFDKEYGRIYGVTLNKENYHMPDTVSQVFEDIRIWEPKSKGSGSINIVATDSLAALSTELELEKGDKMGMRRAKEFSEGFRKLARVIKKNNLLVACSNQMRDGEYGDVTPGGQAIKYYSSLRVSVKQASKVEKKTMFNGKEIKKVIGIESKCCVVKSTVDDPYRECRIFIVFRHGIDDVRGNLQYIKDIMDSPVYICPDDKSYKSMESAINHVEQLDLEEKLREKVIDLWGEVESKLEVKRKDKVRR